MSVIHQFVPTFEPGAVCSHALQLQDALRQAGHHSEIYAEFVRPESSGLARLLSEHSFVDDDVSIYHMAIGSNVADYLRRSRTKIVLNHHNLTPLELIEPWEPGVAYGIQWGMRQLRELAPCTDLAIAVSKFNERELIEIGFKNTAVAPIIFDAALVTNNPDKSVADELLNRKSVGEKLWLSVGRISPNKAQHDLIKAFAYHQAVSARKDHLYLVGASSSVSYMSALNEFIAAEELNDSVTVTGAVSDSVRAAFYEHSDVYVSLSDHEGFCVPLLESFASGLPVVAFGSSAVPETLGNAGLLLNSKNPALVATAVERVLEDIQLREKINLAATQRLDNFAEDKVRTNYVSLIEKVAS